MAKVAIEGAVGQPRGRRVRRLAARISDSRYNRDRRRHIQECRGRETPEDYWTAVERIARTADWRIRVDGDSTYLEDRRR